MIVNVEIGGESRPISLGRNALREFEIITGASILEMNSKALYSMQGIQTLYYVGLKWGLYQNDGKEPNPKFTLFTVGEWLDKDVENGGKLSSKIYALLNDSLPKKDVAVDQAAK